MDHDQREELEEIQREEEEQLMWADLNAQSWESEGENDGQVAE